MTASRQKASTGLRHPSPLSVPCVRSCSCTSPHVTYSPEHNRCVTSGDSTSHFISNVTPFSLDGSRGTRRSHLAMEAPPGLPWFTHFIYTSFWRIFHASVIRSRFNPHLLPPQNVNRSTDGYQITARASPTPPQIRKMCTRGQDVFQKLRHQVLVLSW
ncbi:hypothetical protein BDZ94DRAFT_1271991 [Collybia nuda]|uniref:Uncharacterized protein n=1 Tax=Collybia nuda TaxID=64659 RepID=A0A9P6CCF0_9AGAR|nr:hypothetical protein BDZ94DRAFT_1276703 [Collybia nuda]KAF9457947.1 hypothetical protein BDZ94DRAFT_1271991 [Collybia nuda]